MLLIRRKVNEDIIIGFGDKLVLLRVTEIEPWGRVQLGFEADDSVSIWRKELLDKAYEDAKDGE